jgi:hypothetical protein
MVSRSPKYLWWLGGGVMLASLGIILFQFNPSLYAFYPRCQFYAITGLYCPGCGAQRALHSLVHLHFLTTLRDNAPLILSLPILGYLGVRLIGRELGARMLPALPLPRHWLRFLIIATILFTVLRNIPYSPFNYLAPL